MRQHTSFSVSPQQTWNMSLLSSKPFCRLWWDDSQLSHRTCKRFFSAQWQGFRAWKALDTAFVQQKGSSVSFSTWWVLIFMLQTWSKQLRINVFCFKKGMKNSDENFFLLLTGGIFRTIALVWHSCPQWACNRRAKQQERGCTSR